MAREPVEPRLNIKGKPRAGSLPVEIGLSLPCIQRWIEECERAMQKRKVVSISQAKGGERDGERGRQGSEGEIRR